MRRWKLTLLGTLVAVASFNAAACYTVYDRSSRVVYHASDAPVDMSRPIHETLPQRFPGGHMVFDTAVDCPAVNVSGLGNSRRGASPLSSPLLTDAMTAEKMRLPHTIVAGGVALVPAQQAAMAPGVMVIPSPTTLAAARTPSRDTVITEMRDPPMTVVETDGRVIEATRSMGGPPARKY